MGGNNVINDYIAGAIGGASGLVVGHPFDTTKVQLQTRQTSSPYKGTWDAMKTINKSGMAKGFFRGLGFPLASYGLVNSVFFGVYGNTLRYLKGPEQDRKAKYSETFLAGCCGGFVQLFVACPVDVVKVVLQSQIDRTGDISSKKLVNPKNFRGPIQCTIWLYQQHGVRGLYQGYNAMLLRDVPTYGVYTMVYEVLYHRLMILGLLDKHGVGASLMAGGAAGVACWTLAIPMDVVKSLLQADTQQDKFKNTWNCVKYVYKNKGIRGFFTGWLVCSVRAFPVNAVIFLIYEQTLRLLKFRQPQECVI